MMGGVICGIDTSIIVGDDAMFAIEPVCELSHTQIDIRAHTNGSLSIWGGSRKSIEGFLDRYAEAFPDIIADTEDLLNESLKTIHWQRRNKTARLPRHDDNNRVHDEEEDRSFHAKSPIALSAAQ
jgi:hypothetical protein